MNGKTNASGSGGSTGISIPLEAPTNLALSAEDSKISLTWTDPNDKYTETYNELVSQWSYDSLVRKQGSAPTSINDGTLIAKITGKNQYQNIPYVDTGMENDKEWFYSVFAHNQFNTPSDPIYGSDIPTATIGLEYIQEISPFVPNYDNASFERTVLVGSNGSHVFILSSYGYSLDDTYIIYDKNLVKSTKLTTVIQANTRSINDRGYAPMRIGNNLVIIRNKNNYDYDTNGIYSYYIDMNSIEHNISYHFYGPGSSSGYHLQMNGADVNNLVGYAIKSEMNDDTTLAVRIDTNMIVSTLSNIDDIHDSHFVASPHLSSESYALFGGFDYDVDTLNNNLYIYNVDGVRSTIAISDMITRAASRCGDYNIIWGNLKYTEPNWMISSISDQLVNSLISTIPYLETTEWGNGICPSTPSNIQSINCAIIPIFRSIDMWEAYYEGCLVLNKNLVSHHNDNILPLSIGTSYGYGGMNSSDSPRLGNYIFMPCLFDIDSDFDINNTNGKIYVIKN